MEDTHQRRRKSSWGKRILFIVGGLCVLLIATYFILTSSIFLKSVILPKAGKSLNATITVEDASISPFSKVELHKLRVQTTGSEPLLTAEDVRLRYSLMDIIRGNIKVDEVTLDSPVVQLIQEPDGTSNLDPLLKGGENKNKEDKPKSKEPARVNVRNVTLKNGVVRQIVKSKEGGAKQTELKDLNISLTQLGNSQSGTLNLAALFSQENRQGKTNDVLRGQLGGQYDIALNKDLMPESVKGSAKVTLNQAEGAYKEASGLIAVLDADLTPKEIKDVGLKFSKGNQQLGQLRVSGPMDMATKDGNLRIELLNLDRDVLNLAGLGYDFRESKINSTNQITISQNATFIAASGNLAGRQISLAKAEMITPEIALDLVYQATANLSDKSAVLQRLNLNASRQGQQFLTTTLDKEMNLSWGQAVKGYKDAALQMVLTNFNLADWRAVIGTNISQGVVNSRISIISQQDGKLLKTEIATRINGLSADFGTNKLQNAGISLDANGTVENLKVVNLPKYTLALQQNNSPVLQANGAARYSLETKEVTAQLTADGTLARLMALASVPGANASAGNLKISTTYSDTGGKKQATGSVGIEQFTGGYEKYQFQNYQIALDYNVTINKSMIEIARAAATFSQGTNPGGSVDLKGRYDTEKKSGQVEFKTVDLNENTFRPILAPSLGENKLISISLNASGNANLDPASETSIKAGVKVDKWLVQDKEGKLPKTPLSVQLKIDGGMRQQVLDLRQMIVQLSPTERAKNSLQLQAKLDLSKTNAGPSTLSLISESFDVTPYYNMFASHSTNTQTATTPAPKPAGTPAPGSSSQEQKEPEPISLPFKDLTAQLKIDRFYLNEVAISNWTGNITIRSNLVAINPFKLDLNGGPVNFTGNFDVGTPGYKYDLSFGAENVAVAPVVNTFSEANKGKLQGTFIANAKINGAGITGPSLKKNLGGNINLNMTNLNYQAIGPKLRKILVPISVVLNAPELLSTPINWVSAQTDIGNGEIKLQHLGVESEAFYAESAGTITLADVITNSTLNIPLDLSLRRSLAAKIKMVPAGTPEDAKYAKLPRFVTVKGTLGDPSSDINKTALIGTALKEAAAIGLGNAKTENILGGIGNVLTGQKGNTNSSGTNASPAANILQGIEGLLNKNPSSTATNNAQTNAPAPKTAPSLFDALKGLQKKK
jgi:hypothetical protein